MNHMDNSVNLAIEPLEDLDAPSVDTFAAGVGIGIALVALGVGAVVLIT
jgi:hypothetical protein